MHNDEGTDLLTVPTIRSEYRIRWDEHAAKRWVVLHLTDEGEWVEVARRSWEPDAYRYIETVMVRQVALLEADPSPTATRAARRRGAA